MMQGTQVGHLTDIRKVFVDPVMDNATRAIEEKAVESQAAFVKYLDPVACVTERAVVFLFSSVPLQWHGQWQYRGLRRGDASSYGPRCTSRSS